jgi:ferredoxin hydrogenase
MTKYRCKICGYIYDEDILFKDLKDDWKCPLCGTFKDMFEVGDEKEEVGSEATIYNAVTIYENNPCIERVEGCINCGICTKTCLEREKMRGDEDCLICVGCGQCIITCPKRVLQPKNDIYKFLKAKSEGKICIAYTSPAVRVSIGDGFGYDAGTFLEGKLVSLLRSIGFKYVFDVTFWADLTIMEEASELLDRIKNNKCLPMITSCCPAWVRYAEIFYPDILEHLSTCKSPIGMQGAMVKEYFAKVNNINKDDIYTVAITPCTAKKGEVNRSEIDGTDCVITVSELIDYIKAENINFNDLEEDKFDDILSNGSGAGLIFGNTGGVMESALRTANYLVTGRELKDVDIVSVRGYNRVKESEINLGDISLRVAVIDEIGNALPILDSIKNNNCKYDFIEIMNCRGGCIGGGGQPVHKIFQEQEVKEKRIDSIYKKDKNSKYRYSYQNPNIKNIYDEFLDYPLSPIAHSLLHTTYKDKSELLNGKNN